MAFTVFDTKVASIWISFFPSLLVNKGVSVLKGEREKLRLTFRTTVSRKNKDACYTLLFLQ